MDNTILGLLRERAVTSPSAPVLASPGQETLSYSALFSLVETTGQALAAHGLGRGDRVALKASDRPIAVTAYLALACHTTVVPFSPEMTDAELHEGLRRVGATAICTLEGETPCQSSIPEIILRPRPGGPAGVFEIANTGSGEETPASPAGPDDVACILVTSGTSSRPKAVPLRHRMILHRAASDAAHLQLGPDDVCMNFRAPHLSGPLNAGLMPTLYSGGCVVVPQRFEVDEIFRALSEYDVTWYTGGPAHHSALLAGAAGQQRNVGKLRLRLIRSAGYHLPEKLKTKLEDTFGVVCVEKYGSTETGPVAANPLPPSLRKPGTVGTVLDCDVEVRGDDGMPAGCNRDGEIFVRGKGVFDGYVDDEALNRRSFGNGWFATGDIGRMDADGFLTISGRRSEVINRGGYKVSPEEVEAALIGCAGVSDCICFGVPHETLGQQLVAAAVFEGGQDVPVPTLRAQLQKRLSPHKVPPVILAWESIPRTPAGKPLRRETVERFNRSRAISPSTTAGEGRIILELAQIWADVLGHTPGYDENFFLAGGDSLRAVELISKIEAQFGVPLGFEAIFETGSTLRGMTDFLSQHAATGRWQPENSRLLKLQSRMKAAVRIGENIVKGRPRYDQVRFDDTIEFADIKKRLDLAVTGWPGTRLDAEVPVFAFNRDGTGPPIVWCFNMSKEHALIPLLLEGGQPLFTIRSTNRLVRDRRLRNRFSVLAAEVYAREIDRLLGRGPVALGGMCQAGYIVETIARNLVSRGRNVLQISVIDYQPERPYAGRVAMVFGAESRKHNPFLQKPNPFDDWAQHGEAVWDIIPGGHGDYFKPDTVHLLADRLLGRLREVNGRAQTSSATMN